MKPDLDEVIDRALAEYSRVEPDPAALSRWATEPVTAPRRAAAARLWPVWAAAVAALLLALAVFWMRGKRTPAVAQPLLTQEKMVVVPPNPKDATPLTDEQKALIELLAKDPSALAHLSPDELDKKIKQQEKEKEIKHP